MKTICHGLICLGVAASLQAAAQQPKQKSVKPMPTRKVVYKSVGESELALHVFEPDGHKPGAGRPGIVFFFGGGWNGGTPGQFYQHCAYLASRGMWAASAEYRTKKSHRTTPAECVKDGKSAIRYVRAHAAELGIDPDRVAAGGGSAGGHVAATTAAITAFDEKGEDTTVSAIPNALVLFNPVYDNGPKGYGHDRVKDYWESFSPMHNIREGIPPAIVFLGTKDKLIPVATAETFKKKMETVGARSDLHLFEGQPHGFFNYGRNGGTSYRKTVFLADKFLAALGWLEGDPTIAEQ